MPIATMSRRTAARWRRDPSTCGTTEPDDRQPPTRRDSGTSLIEIIIAVTLMTLVVVPLMSAVQTGIKASTVNEDAAKAETAIVDAADRINRAPQACDYTQYAQASVQTKGWGASQASVSHQFYDPVQNAWRTGGCRFATPTADLVQKLTITITTPGGSVTRSIQVVKSHV